MQREYPDAPIVTVGAVIVREGRVLLIERANPPNKDRWSIPGGVVEVGETLAEAVAREAAEEAQVQVEPGRVVAIRDLILRDHEGRVQYHYVLIDLTARYLSGEPRAGTDAKQVRWVSEAEFEQIDVVPELVPILRSALHGA